MIEILDILCPNAHSTYLIVSAEDLQELSLRYAVFERTIIWSIKNSFFLLITDKQHD